MGGCRLQMGDRQLRFALFTYISHFFFLLVLYSFFEGAVREDDMKRIVTTVMLGMMLLGGSPVVCANSLRRNIQNPSAVN